MNCISFQVNLFATNINFPVNSVSRFSMTCKVKRLKIRAQTYCCIYQQRQQPKHPLYDQRPRAPQQNQPLSGMPLPAAPLASLAGPPRSGPGYVPLGPPPGHGSSGGGPTNSACRVCGKVAVFLCSSCRRVWYCNQQCQV